MVEVGPDGPVNVCCGAYPDHVGTVHAVLAPGQVVMEHGGEAITAASVSGYTPAAGDRVTAVLIDPGPVYVVLGKIVG